MKLATQIESHRGQQAEAAELDAATYMRRVFRRQVTANLKEVWYG